MSHVKKTKKDSEIFPLSGEAIHPTLSYCRPKMKQMVEQKDASEIAITFKQKYRDEFTNDDIMDLVRRFCESYPEEIREMILVPEFGEISLHLHYHGIIRSTLKVKSDLQRTLKRRFGKSEIHMIQYTESYVDYICKQIEQNDWSPWDIIYIKNSEYVPPPTKDTVKLPPVSWDHPLRSTQKYSQKL